MYTRFVLVLVVVASSVAVALKAAADVEPIMRYNASMFCWVLARPTGYEPDLLALQAERRAGIFGCDDYVIVSNVAIDEFNFSSSHRSDQALAVMRAHTLVVPHINFECPAWHRWQRIQGTELHRRQQKPSVDTSDEEERGPFACINTELFLKAWSALKRQGRYKKSKWVLKLDVDTAFNPHTARAAFARVDPSRDLYVLNQQNVDVENLRFHGPVEAITAVGMTNFLSGLSSCENGGVMRWSTELKWLGEDWFFGKCMTHLNITGRYLPFLLRETYKKNEVLNCSCNTAAWHPMKDMHGMAACANTFRKCTDQSHPEWPNKLRRDTWNWA